MFKSITRFIGQLFFGQEHTRPTNKVRPAIKNQWLNVKRIWRNENYKDFGIERIIRLSLSLSLFAFPGLYVRAIGEKCGLLGRKLGVEFYVIIKLVLPISFFVFGCTDSIAIASLSGYMIFETFIYLVALMFLSTEFASPISYRRSLTLLFMNYVEVCLHYAVIYSYCNLAICGFIKKPFENGIQAIYFSFVTSATVGYGDYVPTTPFGQFLVVSQILLFLLFLALFINFFASKVHDPTYYNPQERKISKYPNSRNKFKNREHNKHRS